MFVTKFSSNCPQLYPFLSNDNSYLPPHCIPQQYAMELVLTSLFSYDA